MLGYEEEAYELAVDQRTPSISGAKPRLTRLERISILTRLTSLNYPSLELEELIANGNSRRHGWPGSGLYVSHIHTYLDLWLSSPLAPLDSTCNSYANFEFWPIMSQRPTIILVHGAYHQPEHFDVVTNYLNEAGFKVVRPRLPSVGMTSDPGDALHLDAGAVRDALHEEIVQQGNDVVLVMHSYGGLAGSEGYGMFQTGLGSAKSLGVRRLVYLAAHGVVDKGFVFIPEDVNPPHLSINVRIPLRMYV